MFLNVRVSYVARTVVLLVLLATICVSLVQADGTYPNITVIAVSPLGTDRYLLYGSDRGNVSVIDLQRLWDPFASVLVQEFKIEAFSKIRDLKFSPDGKIVAVAGFSPSQHDSKRFPYHTCGSVKELAGVALLDVAKGFEVIDTPIDDSISIDFLDNQRLVVLTPTELLIWNLNTRNVEKAQKINRGRVAVVDPETKDIGLPNVTGKSQAGGPI
jgi:WD40 repeat protein